MGEPHVHPCPECYSDAICGLDCNTSHTTSDEDERKGLKRGDACVCGLCLKRAGLPTDMFCAELPHDLTPSEVALARVLWTWAEWQPSREESRDGTHPMFRVGKALRLEGLVMLNALTAEGTALLDRARKAGVL